jgi:serine protease Do
MKKTQLIIGRTAVALVGASAILTAAFALESQTNIAGSPPAVTLDLKPLDRTSRLPASFSDIIKKVTPAVVKIEVTGRAVPAAQFGDLNGQQFGDMELPPALRRFFEQRGQQPQGGQRRMQQPRGHGAASGVIVTPDGYILTNNHVVDDAGKVEVTLHDGRKLTAKVVGTDPKSDLAVVKIDTTGLPAIAFADSSAAEVGDVVLAAGNPFGLGQTVTLGMISAVGRASMGLDYEDFIQTDAAINPGNSGGALVDAQGRLVGINTAIYSRSGGNDGIGFAIPSNMARSIMNDLISGGQVNRGYLGVMIQDLTPALASEFKAPADTRGALVSDVPAKSPAAKAGLESGDIITSINNQPVKDARGLKLAVATHKPGETATLQVLREGSVKTLTATLAEQPGAAKSQPAKHKVGQASEGTLNGVAVADLNKEARQQFNIPADVQGALITDVQEDSPSWEAGLRPGDVIQQIDRKPVSSAEEAANLTEAPATEATLVKVWSRGGSRFVSVDETAKEKGVS